MLDANLEDEDDDLLTSFFFFFSATTTSTAIAVKETDGGGTSLAHVSKETTMLRNMSHVLANIANDEKRDGIDNDEAGGRCGIIGRGGRRQLPSSSSSSADALRNDHRFNTLDDDSAIVVMTLASTTIHLPHETVSPHETARQSGPMLDALV